MEQIVAEGEVVKGRSLWECN